MRKLLVTAGIPVAGIGWLISAGTHSTHGVKLDVVPSSSQVKPSSSTSAKTKLKATGAKVGVSPSTLPSFSPSATRKVSMTAMQPEDTPPSDDPSDTGDPVATTDPTTGIATAPSPAPAPDNSPPPRESDPTGNDDPVYIPGSASPSETATP